MKKFIAFLGCVLLLFVMQPLTIEAVALDTGPQISMIIALPAVAGVPVTVAESAAILQTDDPGAVVGSDVGGFLKSNWVEILCALMGVWEIIARSTKTTVDNSIISLIMKIINVIFPNRKTGGGVIIPLTQKQLDKSLK